MEKGSLIFILLLVVAVCYIIYDSMPSKYTRLDENFGGFINRRVLRFEFEKSPLHTIIYGATGTGKTYFVRQYLKLYVNGNSSVKPDGEASVKSNQDQEQVDKNIIERGQVDKNIIEKGQVDKNIIEQGRIDKNMAEHQGTCFSDGQRPIIIVCKDERDWINPETGVPYVGFEMGDINMITMENIDKFKNSIIVLDDMGSEFSRHIKYYFTEGRHNNIQVIAMCHKPAHR